MALLLNCQVPEKYLHIITEGKSVEKCFTKTTTG
jgi:hypothetical protein